MSIHDDPSEAIQLERTAGSYHENGVFLWHAYVTTVGIINAFTGPFLMEMAARGVRTVYVNLGKMDATGRIPATDYPQLTHFLDTVNGWEVAHKTKFQIFGWLNGNLNPAEPDTVDLSTDHVRTAILSEAERFLSRTATDSHVAAAKRELDGVLFDLEPSGPFGVATAPPDDTRFNDWKTLMQQMRRRLDDGDLSHKLTAVAAHRWGDESARTWAWPQRYFYYMGRYVNQIVLMSYNSGSTSEADYQAWIQNNVRQALRSLSGQAYGSPTTHPPPTSGVKLFVGFPAYPANDWHVPAYENVAAAARGTKCALSALMADTTDSSETYFGGAAVYAHTDGLDRPKGYALHERDWQWWNTAWLGTDLAGAYTSRSVKEFGAFGDGVTDDTLAFQAALDSGARRIVVPDGTYLITGVEIKADSDSIDEVAFELIGEGRPTILLAAAPDRIAIKVSKRRYVDISNLRVKSNGTKSDGHDTVGVHYVANRSRQRLRHVRLENFSLAGIRQIQGLYTGYDDIDIRNCKWGISVEKSDSASPTTCAINRAYITACTRGIHADGLVGGVLSDLIFESCGDSSSIDGAFHLVGGARRIQVDNIYFEGNHRDMVLTNSRCTFIELNKVTAATAPDVISQPGVLADNRGLTQIRNDHVKTARLQPDDLMSLDLTIGTNLIVPLAGGSVRWGNTTTETITVSGNTASWSTVKTFIATEMSGTNNQRAAYIYTVFAGGGSTGSFDCGVIMNGSIYSFSGSLPSWLRLDGNNLQCNIPGSGGAYTMKVVLLRMFPGS